MLNRRHSFDPRWMTYHRKVVRGPMMSTIQWWRPEGDLRWDAQTNELAGAAKILLWEGPARVQDNKDWRARDAHSASDPQMLQYVRVQIPLDDPDAGPPPPLNVQDIGIVVDAEVSSNSSWPLDRELSRWRLHVRNTLNSSYPWLRNVLCVIDLSADTPIPQEGS